MSTNKKTGYNKVLVVDSGARGHALLWKLSQSDRVGQLYSAPGNGGTQSIAKNIGIKVTDVDSLLKFVKEEGIDFTVASQDDSLAAEIVDRFQANGLKIFGPTAGAAQIESSKSFAKRTMMRAGVPTANFRIFTSAKEARAHVHKYGVPIVIKASGLALGKGAYVCMTIKEAEQAIDDIMVKRVHGDAGKWVIIEDFLEGPEVSIQAFCDGKNFSLFPVSQDFKREFDGEKGRNTGGMGAIVSVPWFTKDMTEEAYYIVMRMFTEMARLRKPFVGVLYPGLKVTPQGLKVLEFNARPGDPETQSCMPLLKTDLFDVLEACVDGNLANCKVEWHSGYSATVVLASGGYPGDYKKGMQISGIADAEKLEGVTLFHAGTTIDADGVLRTFGGRVLSVNTVRDTLAEAIRVAYKAADLIQFEGKYCRRDIGAESLRQMAKA
jgi:phosphoribosylamine--glycine ligase